MTLQAIPELLALDSSRGLIRIPPEVDIPLTGRVRAVIDTRVFRRLAWISQLGLVALVYPAAHHRRFEHALGVYRLALLYLRHLARDSRFAAQVSAELAERFLVASLLHDIGHWPFCHLIEDLQLPGIPRHEELASRLLHDDELASILRVQWRIEPEQIVRLLSGRAESAAERILQSMLSGPIDVDKMDYLMRDSLHAGVPYGRNFDQSRLIGSLCLNQAGDGLALTDKGRTAAEMMVFARYVMFSEVYWHHAVRAATAMLQRAFYELHERLELAELFGCVEAEFIEHLTRAAGSLPVACLLQGLFGPRRELYKRWRQYTYNEHGELYAQLARQSYDRLVRCAEALARELSEHLGQRVPPEGVLIDAPPRKLEVQFRVEIVDPQRGVHRPLVDVSPVVRTLAETQFDDYVKRVRIFVAPEWIGPLRASGAYETQIADGLVQRAIDAASRG